MKVNEGKADRVIRIVLGIGLAAGGFFTAGAVQMAMFVLAGILIITGAIGFCGLYTVLGINTCPVKKK